MNTLSEQIAALKDGDPVVVQVSACCDADMTGVEYGDHQACRRCKLTDRTWVEHVAPFIKGHGPDWPNKRPLEDGEDIGPYFYWG